MPGIDTADRIIRNQRYRGWPVFVCMCAWALTWMGAAVVLERWLMPRVYYGPPYHLFLWLGWGIPMLASFVYLLIRIDRWPPKRLKLGDELWAVPGPRLPVKEIRSFRFAPDPDEDYVETRLPVPCCELSVELRRRRLRLIVSCGDAARAREWAERVGVPVIDPEGYSTRWSRNEPA